MTKTFFALLSVFLFLSSCNNLKTEKITIASENRDCTGLIEQKCLLIKYEGKSEWEFYYSGIEGFNYEPGYEYVLEVKKEKLPEPIPADSPSEKYVLAKEISKTQKKSENLPI